MKRKPCVERTRTCVQKDLKNIDLSGKFLGGQAGQFRASTIRSNQQAIRIKVVYLCLVGGE
jgi:hypothetical protein